MTNLPYVLQLLNNEKITGDQTMIIDAALSSINPKEIPDIDTSNVIDYIDAQLKYNNIDAKTQETLNNLQEELRLRKLNCQ